MYHTQPNIRIFAQEELRPYLNNTLQSLYSKIQSESDSYLLNVSETIYLEHLVSEYSVENLRLDFEDKYISNFEANIPAKYFPSFAFNVRQGESYPKPVIRIHIPFSGNQELIYLRPSWFLSSTPLIGINSGEVYFDVIDFYDNNDDPERIKREITGTISTISKQVEAVVNDVSHFNGNLLAQAKNALDARRKKLLVKHSKLSKLGIPLKKNPDLAATFSVPIPSKRKKITFPRPIVTDSDFIPEPALNDVAYREILNLLHSYGRGLEQKPAIYKGKGEEALRDHFITFLEPFYEGTVTGETFNKAGKTDILLRYDGGNAFIAECKIWKGRKSFLKTISQLLGYLTWRDSKSAIILFVQNKGFSSIIEEVKNATPEHPNFVKYIGEHDKTWIDFIIHLNGDPNREVKLAVLLFHFPPPSFSV